VSATVAVVVLLAGCGDDDGTAATTSTTSTTSGAAATGAVGDPGLRRELLRMLATDQSLRGGEPVAGVDADTIDADNQARLAEIFDEHGWPGWSLVGEDGSTAAWLIVQHADLDPAFQRRGLELLEAAVEAGDASPGDLAYLIDRVRVAEGEPQVYGTQWRIDETGGWTPATPIEDEATVDERRADVGLQPLDDYLEELQALEG
jgi:hypothetical protein